MKRNKINEIFAVLEWVPVVGLLFCFIMLVATPVHSCIKHKNDPHLPLKFEYRDFVPVMFHNALRSIINGAYHAITLVLFLKIINIVLTTPSNF